MPPIPIPTLPASVVTILGVLVVVLTVSEPHLPYPWRGIAGVVLAILATLGVTATNTAIRGHAEAVRKATLAETAKGDAE